MPGDPYYQSKQWLGTKRKPGLRGLALKRDKDTCVVPGCGAKATRVDHIKRRKDGGADALHNLRSLCTTHDGQIKEKPDGTRANGGKFKILGCTTDGWPLARS
jgi:5-methylcytosine-specific restriction endonuclease McrA